MIPKKIHYCWFGKGEKGEDVKKCIASWKKFCPDYEIIEWNEENFDIDMMPFTKQAYAAKKYAFVSDVARLYALYLHGGIYFDTDVEVIRCFDALLSSKAFLGFENEAYVANGLCFGSEKNNDFVKENLDAYRNIGFLKSDGRFNMVGSPHITTGLLVKRGLIQNGKQQQIDGIMIYPPDYFNPYDCIVDRLNIGDNTYSIHRFSNSWGKKRSRTMKALIKYYHRFLRKIGKI